MSVGIMTVPIYGKIKNVPNHQPAMVEKNVANLIKEDSITTSH